MDLEKAKEIVKGRLQFGNPEHLEAVRMIEQDRKDEAAVWNGFDIEVQIVKNSVTGVKRTRISLPKEAK